MKKKPHERLMDDGEPTGPPVASMGIPDMIPPQTQDESPRHVQEPERPAAIVDSNVDHLRSELERVRAELDGSRSIQREANAKREQVERECREAIAAEVSRQRGMIETIGRLSDQIRAAGG